MKLPRSVVVVDDVSYLDMENESRGLDLIEDPTVMVLKSPSDSDSDQTVQVRRILDDVGAFEHGALFVLNPYQVNAYIPAHEAVEVLTMTKYSMMAKFASLLGAKKVKLDSTEVDFKRSSGEAKVGATVKVVKGDAAAKEELKQRIERRVNAEWQFRGGEADLESARAYLRSRNLRDYDLESLIELREGDYPLLRRVVRLNATRESARNLEAALKVANSGRVKLAGADARFGLSGVSEISVDLVTEIVF